ncbi:MAG TPA: 4Fe-4S binding protein [Acidimicrobiales bacterium]|nr:4Fe-4S binding protein [Acidimicrobiales bacterium]
MTQLVHSEERRLEASAPLDPVAVAIRLRPPVRSGLAERFEPSDPPKGWDLAAHPRVARLLRSRKFQFALILPNQIIFWLVIFLGLLGTVVPGLNFGTAITWYIWFCLVFVLMVVVGRAWCVMCPFGGFAEWVQRRTFWKRAQHRLGLGRKLPEPVARYGFLLSVGTFLLLTWIEEYFNIAGPGNPWATSFMVLGIVTSALAFFLVFERRTFCRYLCPLTALIGTVGAMGSVAGFRTRDRQICLGCKTKDCMRGGVNGYGCPWYTWPGSADSNLACGLCSECYKGCPEDNIGLYLQRPLTSVVAPTRRRADVAWAVAVLWGLVIFQQVNATKAYAAADGWLNRFTHLAYPNPIDYVGIIALVALGMAGIAKLVERTLARPDLDPAPAARRAPQLSPAARSLAFSGLSPTPDLMTSPVAVGAGGASAGVEMTGQSATGKSFISRTSRFRMYFLPLMYGLIPVVGADYFARQLPKFFKHASRIVPAVGHLFGAGSTHSALYNTRILPDPGIVAVQVAVIALGTAASAWASWKIAGRELVGISRHAVAARAVAVALPVACGLTAALLYVIMHAAS